jgi:hypothetical protein
MTKCIKCQRRTRDFKEEIGFDGDYAIICERCQLRDYPCDYCCVKKSLLKFVSRDDKCICSECYITQNINDDLQLCFECNNIFTRDECCMSDLPTCRNCIKHRLKHIDTFDGFCDDDCELCREIFDGLQFILK